MGQRNLKRHYDCIVVGAGTAGSVVAARLAMTGRTLLLVEAGPDYPELSALPDDLRHGASNFASVVGAAHNWSLQGRPTRDAVKAIHVPRGRVVGGSGAINGQVFLRGLPEDYTDWSFVADDSWSFESVVEIFKEMEADADFGDDPNHGANGCVPVRRYSRESWLPFQELFFEACCDAGLPASPDLNHPESSGVGAIPFNTLAGVRMSTALTHLSGARRCTNLTICPNTVVERLVLRGNRAVGVEAVMAGRRLLIGGDAIVCCSGAYGSPQLLMKSGIGPPMLLREAGVSTLVALPGVGQNLHDHPSVALRYGVKSGTSLDPYAPRYQVAVRFPLDARNDGHILPSSYSYGDPAKPLEPEGVRLLCMLGKPVSRGEVGLSKLAANGRPDISFNFLGESSDRSRLREIIYRCEELASSMRLSRILDEQVVRVPKGATGALDAWLANNVTTTHHAAGTCKMGRAPDPMAVVDERCRVHGVEQLRIADASVIPFPMTSHINATVVMLAERLASWLT